jgi:hypothetical protein
MGKIYFLDFWNGQIYWIFQTSGEVSSFNTNFFFLVLRFSGVFVKVLGFLQFSSFFLQHTEGM